MNRHTQELVDRLQSHIDNTCWFCKRKDSFDPRWLRPLLILQTPQSVWREYRSSGYTIDEALQEELSYL